MNRMRVAVLISGRGSNMKALIDAAASPDYPAAIVLVIANVPGAGGLVIAEAAGVATMTIDHKSFGKGADGKRKFESALSAALKEARVDLVCLAGFMRLLSAEFVAEWPNRLINIHPSLLPAFKGLDVHADMLRAGVKIAGCTVHFVSAEMDAGPIIGQAAVPVLAGDTAESLAARILAAEHRLYPECLRLIATGRAQVKADGIVEIDAGADGVLVNPSGEAAVRANRRRYNKESRMGILKDSKPVVIIATRDRKVSEPFYRDTLGLPLIGDDPYAAVFGLNGAVMRLSAIADWTPHAHTVFGFEVDDIAASVRALTTKGVKFIVYPGFGQSEDGIWSAPGGGAKVAWFNDPDGNNLSLTQFGG